MPLRPRYKSKFVLLGIFLCVCFFAVMGLVAHNYSHSERFSDEAAHMAGGYFILKGRIPYTNLQFNHQPLNYLFAAATDKIFPTHNLYTYISRQRDAVYVYALVWNVIYLFTFGLPIFIFSVIFELSKYWLSGYKLLGETLAVYPIMYMVGIFLKIFFGKEPVKGLSLVLFSISTFIVAFSLLPLWPLLLFLNALVLFHFRKEKIKLFYMIFPVFLLTTGLFLYISLKDFIKETIIYNAQYFIPSYSTDFPIVRTVLFPFVSLMPPYSIPQVFIAILVVLFFSIIFILLKKKRIKMALFLTLLLFLSNLRVDNYDFSGFHFLPWFGILLFLVIYFGNHLKKETQQYTFYGYYILIGLLILWLYIFTKNPLNQQKNLLTEQEVNYSSSETFGNAIKIMKDTDDKLMVIPGDALIHKVADIDTATRVLEYFPWVYTIPEYQKEIYATLKNNPPTFIVDTGLRRDMAIDHYVQSLLKQDYIELKHVEKPSHLYIRREKFKSLSTHQWEELRNMLFEKP